MLDSFVQARLIGHDERPYESFQKNGVTHPPGVTHHVTLADPSTGRTQRYKVRSSLLEQLLPAMWGGLVSVKTRTYEKGPENKRYQEQVIVEVGDVEKALLVIKPDAA